jgi:hypothetical protein
MTGRREPGAKRRGLTAAFRPGQLTPTHRRAAILLVNGTPTPTATAVRHA